MFAHPDDEVFCAGGTIAAAVEAGAEAMIVSATRGEAGQIRDAAAATRATLGEVREQELRDACRHLGVQHVRCLDHIDGTLAEPRPTAARRRARRGDRRVRPRRRVTFGPDGAYGHPDHITVGEAVTEACLERPAAPAVPLALRPHPAAAARAAVGVAGRAARAVRRPHRTSPACSRCSRSRPTAVGYADDHINVGWYPPGVFIVEQGEAADTLFLILSGEVEVAQDAPGRDPHRPPPAGPRGVLRRAGRGPPRGPLGERHRASRR